MNMIPCLHDFAASAKSRRLLALVLSLIFFCACAPASQPDEELHKEIQSLRAQVTAMQEKLNQIQGGQQAIIEMLKQPTLSALPPKSTAVPNPAPGPGVMTVSQLLASKDSFLGSRVTVRGMAGPVMVHHKSLMLKSPQGLVEVFFGNLPDPKLVQTLSSTPLDKPLTVTGIANLPPSPGGGAKLQITAEAVEF